MAELRMIHIGGDRPIQVPVGVRMAYLDELGRENVVFVPNFLQTATMGEWDEQEVPVLILSTQSRTLWSGAPIEWLAKEAQGLRILSSAEATAHLRPLTLTAADLLEWARLSRDPELPAQLMRVALQILAWLGRPPMNPLQHQEWTQKARRSAPEP